MVLNIKITRQPRRQQIGRFLRTNRGVSIVLAFTFGAIALSILLSDWAYRELRDGFLLGGFPIFALAMIAISLLILAIDNRSTETEPGMAALHGGVLLVMGAVLLGLAATFALMWIIGFVPAAALFIITGSFILGCRPAWKAVAIGVGASITIRIILAALGVAIPDGPIALLIGAG